MPLIGISVFIDGIDYEFDSKAINQNTLCINLPKLKEEIEWYFGVPKQNQRILYDGKEIVDGHTYPCTGEAWSNGAFLFVDHHESTESPYRLGKEFMRRQWPSMMEEELDRLLIELNDLSKGVVNRVSLTEREDNDTIDKSKELLSQVVMVLLFSPTGKTIVENGNCLTFKGQKMYLYEMLEDGSGATVTTTTYGQYQRSTPEEYQRVKESNAKYEEDLCHCVKLLHDLPIALSNSEKALAAVDETSEGVDMNELGAMVIEQKRIRREIKAQEANLQHLHSEPLNCLDANKFPKHQFFSSLILRYGMNCLPTGDIIQLIRVSDIDMQIPNPVSITMKFRKILQSSDQTEQCC